MAALLLIAALWAAQMVGGAPTYKLPSVQELTRMATVVVLGEVTRVSSEWDSSRGLIFTQVELQIEQILKGSKKDDQLTFYQPGGKVGKMAAVVAGTPAFAENEKVLLFLSKRGQTLGIVGLFHGKFSIETDKMSGMEIAIRREPDSDRVLDRFPLDDLISKIFEALTR